MATHSMTKTCLSLFALVGLVAMSAIPVAAADPIDDGRSRSSCAEAPKNSACQYQGGNCNSNGTYTVVNVWINNDCSNTQTLYYCNTAAGSGAASVGVATGASTDAKNGEVGASAGGGCDQRHPDGGPPEDPGQGGPCEYLAFISCPVEALELR